MHFIQEKKKRQAEAKRSGDASDTKDEKDQVITLRPLNMEDLKHAKGQVGLSDAINFPSYLTVQDTAHPDLILK